MADTEWKEFKLGELSLSITDGTHSTVVDNPNGKCFLLSCKNVRDGRIVVGENERRIDEETLCFLKKRTKLSKGDVLLTTVGTVGEMAVVNEENINYEFQRSVGIIKPNHEIVSSEFLYYALRSEKTQVLSRVKGAVQQCLFLGDMKEIVLKIPSFEEQKRIASILSSLDDKIELNNKINDNLEKQAQTLFKNWFIDYAPFGGEELVETPAEFSVPKSLKMIQVADYPHVLETGRRPKGGAVSEGIPSIGAENVKQLGVFDYSSNKFIPEEFAEFLGKGKIEGYELLLYKDGGKPGTFTPHFSMFGEGYPYEECYINEHVFKLDFGNKALNIFAYFYFQTDYVVSWLANNGGKAAIPGINQNDVNAIWIYDLNHPKVREFGEVVKPMFEQILKNCRQNRELSIIRDTLLPKLMSGEIDVENIQI